MKQRALLLCTVLSLSCHAKANDAAAAPIPTPSAAPTVASTGDAVPEPLRATFDRLVSAFAAGDVEAIRREALPHAVSITSTPREKNDEYGTDLNLPFVRGPKFDPKLRVARRDGSCCMLLRTSSSYLHFVELKEGWRLYRYGDKPIE